MKNKFRNILFPLAAVLSTFSASAFSDSLVRSGFVASNGTFPVEGALFSTYRVRYICSSGMSGYSSPLTESTRLYFRSFTVAPSPGTRVRIWNVSGEFSASPVIPYTDREYDNGLRSEGFDVLPGTGHENRYFIVAASELDNTVNKFRFEVRKNDQILDSGEFTGTFRDQYVGEVTRFDDPFYCPFNPTPPFPRPY